MDETLRFVIIGSKEKLSITPILLQLTVNDAVALSYTLKEVSAQDGDKYARPIGFKRKSNTFSPRYQDMAQVVFLDLEKGETHLGYI